MLTVRTKAVRSTLLCGLATIALVASSSVTAQPVGSQQVDASPAKADAATQQAGQPADAGQGAPAGGASARSGAPATEEAATITVTGSRIASAGFNAPTPRTSVGTEIIEQRAPAAISELLNDLPPFRASSGPSQNQRNSGATSSGQATVDLRGLGAVRTLVLVNGRRVVPTNDQSTVDTALIPVGLISTVDVVTGGASAAYGSDAVAGVVNFVLKNRLEGLQGTVQVGQSSHGDNDEFGFNISGGTTFAGGRGHLIFGADFNDNRGVGNISARDWANIEPGNSGTPISFGANRPAGTPAQGFLPHVEYSAQSRGGIINTARTATGAVSNALNQIAFAPDGSLYTLVRGTVYGALMAGVTTNYGASPLNNWPLRQPSRRGVVMAVGTYELSDDTEVSLELNYGHVIGNDHTQYHQTPSNIILISNPFIPAALRAQMVQNNITQIDIGRIDTEWPGGGGPNKVDTYRGTFALKGKVFGGLQWDAYYQYGKSSIDSKITGSAESNILAATYAVAGPNGQPVCGPIATNPNFVASRLTSFINPNLVTDGCVPFNPFGINQASKEAIDYVYNIQQTYIDVVRHAAAINLSGSPFSLPAGELSLAGGIEFRRDSLRQLADPLAERGIYSAGNLKSYTGKTVVWDGYLELGAPLLKDIPLVRSLDLNAAVRQTHYDTSGWVTTWKVGAVYDVVQGVRFRATQSRDIRAPTLNELFSVGGAQISTTFFNPFTGVSARLPFSLGGNPDLDPEKADTTTVGMILQPGGAFSGLRVSIDYFKINVKDVIAPVAPTDAVQRCYQGLASFCSAITFDSSAFGIFNVRSQPFNQAGLKSKGLDFEVSYRVPMANLGLPGRLNLRALATHTIQLARFDRAGTSVVVTENAGTGAGVPEWTWNVFANYDVGPFGFGTQFRSFSPIRYRNDLVGPDQPGYDPTAANSININRFPSRLYIDANAKYDLLGGKLQLFANVINLTNREPHPLALAAVNLGGNPYDYVGRTYRAGVRVKI